MVDITSASGAPKLRPFRVAKERAEAGADSAWCTHEHIRLRGQKQYVPPEFVGSTDVCNFGEEHRGERNCAGRESYSSDLTPRPFSFVFSFVHKLQRFGLRSLLIAKTLVAVVLGLAVWVIEK
jgi:hypothetical protein